MMELLFSNSIAMIWRRVQVIIILVLFLRIKKGIYGLEQTGVFIYNPAVDVFKRFKIASSEGITLDNWVAEILSDSLDNIWVLIPDQGLFRYKDGKVHHYSLIDKDNLKNNNPECICINEQGEVWVGTSGIGLFKYNYRDDNFEQYLTDRMGRSLIDKTIISICFQKENAILGIHEGDLLKYNTRTDELSEVSFLGEKKHFCEM